MDSKYADGSIKSESLLATYILYFINRNITDFVENPSNFNTVPFNILSFDYWSYKVCPIIVQYFYNILVIANTEKVKSSLANTTCYILLALQSVKIHLEMHFYAVF